MSLVAKFHYERGNLKYKLGAFKEALIDFDSAIGIDPEYIEAYYVRSRSNEVLGNEKIAKEDLKKALKLAQNAGYEDLEEKILIRLSIME